MIDLLVLGAGPAGCAAAIQARRAGLCVHLVEARERPRAAPGETLHPGIESLLARLGVRDAVLNANFHRHRGIWIAWDGPPRFEGYGHDETGPWLGFQAERRRLQEILLDAVRHAGATVAEGATAGELIVESSRVQGVVASGHEMRARWTADGTGRSAFVARSLRLTATNPSPPLRARFGWRDSDEPGVAGEPSIAGNADGWEWRAPLGAGREAWVSLHVGDDASAAPVRGGTDVSWRCYAAAAGPGYFLLGDAAAVFDPASSHGVLRAVMSGMLGAHLVHGHVDGWLPEVAAIAEYRRWLRRQFDDDVRELRKLYLRHPSPRVAALFAAWPKRRNLTHGRHSRAGSRDTVLRPRLKA